MHTIKPNKYCSILRRYALPTLLLCGTGSAIAEDARVNGFIENATYVRDNVGLSKFRNTLQIEAEKQYGNKGMFSNV